MQPILTLFAAEGAEPSKVALPEGLRALYGGGLSFPAAPEGRPYCVANFVETLDGVVSFNLPGESEGAEISKSNEQDRFVMGLLRASADAVLVGSGTLKASGPRASWLPEAICPAAKDLYREYRVEVLRKPEYPQVVVVTGSGEVDLASGVFHSPQRVLLLTTEQGERRLAQGGVPSSVEMRVMAEEGVGSASAKGIVPAAKGIAPAAILALLRREMGVELLLHEAGPTLFGEFLAAGSVDELFLTIAPQMAGRAAEQPRPGLVAGVAFTPATAPWWRLVSTKSAGDYLFLRYRVGSSG